MTIPMAASTGWYVGLIVGIVVVLVVAGVVVCIVALAQQIAGKAAAAVDGVTTLRAQTDQLEGVERINDSGVRILRSARSLRKVAVGK